jgi:putative Holliday junction resolvase
MSETPSAPRPARGRIAGIDYGTVRVGIAVSNPDRTLASPLESYTRQGREQDARRMQRLVREEQIALFVVGLPVHLDGRESQKSSEARRFGQWLSGVTGVTVEYFDERFTSAEAEQYLTAAKMTSKRRKQRIDMVAAQIMLSAFLEAGGRGQDNPGGLDDNLAGG